MFLMDEICFLYVRHKDARRQTFWKCEGSGSSLNAILEIIGIQGCFTIINDHFFRPCKGCNPPFLHSDEMLIS